MTDAGRRHVCFWGWTAVIASEPMATLLAMVERVARSTPPC